jgi:hypothetical protein
MQIANAVTATPLIWDKLVFVMTSSPAIWLYNQSAQLLQ